MFLVLTKARWAVLAAPALALLIGLPAAASDRRDPTDDRSLLCDLIGLFCGPEPNSDPDHTPPVPASGAAQRHRSANPEKSFPTTMPPPPAPPPPPPVPAPSPPPSPPSPKP